MRLLVSVVVLVGCYKDSSVVCGDLLCPQLKICAPDESQCISPTQVDACASRVDGDGCSFPGTADGVCNRGYCIATGCGNGLIDGDERCDDGNRISGDGCRADCASDERCGNGIEDPAQGELCDCGDGTGTMPPSCSGPNGDVAGASCRTSCRPARCGDGIVDANELCDDGNTRSGDGCRADCQGRFAKMQVPTLRSLNAVWTAGPELAYAVGVDGTVLRFDGTTWTPVSVDPSRDFEDVWGSGPDNVYIRSRDRVFHFDGTAWQPILFGYEQMQSFTIGAVWGTGPTDVYVAGSYLLQDGENETLTALFEHFDGQAWTAIPWCGATPPTGNYVAMGGSSPDDVFVASRDICHKTAAGWALSGTVAAGAATDLVGGFGQVWIPTTVGTTHHRTLAGTWEEVSLPGSAAGAGTAGPSEVLMVGGYGMILSYTGTAWSTVASPTELTLLDVAGTSPTNVFIVGEGGTILH